MRQGSLLIIFLIVFIDLVSFGIMIPVLPYYAQAFGATGWALGWLITSYALAQFLTVPVWGWISDRLGRRPVLLVSLVGTSLSMAILGLSGTLRWLFIGRLLGGISAATLPIAYDYVADVARDEDRARGWGLLGAALGLGFIFGPAIGGTLARYGYSAPMYFGALLALANFAFAFFKLEEPRLPPEQRTRNRGRRLSWSVISRVLEDPEARAGTISLFLAVFALVQLETIFALYLANRFRYDAEYAGFLVAIVGLVAVAVEAGFLRKFTSRWSEARLTITGAALSSVGIVLFASTGYLAVLVLGIFVLAIGYGLLYPPLSGLALRNAPLQERPSAMGVLQTAGALAGVIAPPVAGWLFDKISWRSPFFCAAIVMFCVCALGLSRRFIRRKPVSFASSWSK